jgi:hypothetical protein
VTAVAAANHCYIASSQQAHMVLCHHEVQTNLEDGMLGQMLYGARSGVALRASLCLHIRPGPALCSMPTWPLCSLQLNTPTLTLPPARLPSSHSHLVCLLHRLTLPTLYTQHTAPRQVPSHNSTLFCKSDRLTLDSVTSNTLPPDSLDSSHCPVPFPPFQTPP